MRSCGAGHETGSLAIRLGAVPYPTQRGYYMAVCRANVKYHTRVAILGIAQRDGPMVQIHVAPAKG